MSRKHLIPASTYTTLSIFLVELVHTYMVKKKDCVRMYVHIYVLYIFDFDLSNKTRVFCFLLSSEVKTWEREVVPEVNIW